VDGAAAQHLCADSLGQRTQQRLVSAGGGAELWQTAAATIYVRPDCVDAADELRMLEEAEVSGSNERRAGR
jgi:hypothetical protein